MSLAGDSAIVRLQTEPPVTQAFAFTRLERYAGRRTRAPEGTLIGAVVGGGIGFLVATGVSTPRCGDATWCLDRQQTRLALTPGGLVIGMLVGLWMGKGQETDRWKAVVR
jgi:hypothetical protein